MKLFPVFLLASSLSVFGQGVRINPIKISEYPNTNALGSNSLFIIAIPGRTNFNISAGQMSNMMFNTWGFGNGGGAGTNNGVVTIRTNGQNVLSGAKSLDFSDGDSNIVFSGTYSGTTVTIRARTTNTISADTATNIVQYFNSRQSEPVANIADFGGVPYIPSVFNGVASVPGSVASNNVAAYYKAQAACLASRNVTNTVFFPYGVWQFTSSLVITGKINWRGIGISHVADKGSPNNLTYTNNYSILWFNSGSPAGVISTNNDFGYANMQWLEINGATNPIAFTEGASPNLENVPSSALNDGPGLLLSRTSTGASDTAGGFQANNIVICGFKRSIEDRINSCNFDTINVVSCDYGPYFVSTPGSGGDQTIFQNCAVGERKNGVGYNGGYPGGDGPRGLVIIDDSSYRIGQWMVLTDCVASVVGGNIELNTSTNIGYTEMWGSRPVFNVSGIRIQGTNRHSCFVSYRERGYGGLSGTMSGCRLDFPVAGGGYTNNLPLLSGYTNFACAIESDFAGTKMHVIGMKAIQRWTEDFDGSDKKNWIVGDTDVAQGYQQSAIALTAYNNQNLIPTASYYPRFQPGVQGGLGYVDAIIDGFEITATTVSNSATVAVTYTNGIVPGYYIAGTGIPGLGNYDVLTGTKITALSTSSNITLSAVATANQTNVVLRVQGWTRRGFAMFKQDMSESSVPNRDLDVNAFSAYNVTAQSTILTTNGGFEARGQNPYLLIIGSTNGVADIGHSYYIVVRDGGNLEFLSSQNSFASPALSISNNGSGKFTINSPGSARAPVLGDQTAYEIWADRIHLNYGGATSLFGLTNGTLATDANGWVVGTNFNGGLWDPLITSTIKNTNGTLFLLMTPTAHYILDSGGQQAFRLFPNFTDTGSSTNFEFASPTYVRIDKLAGNGSGVVAVDNNGLLSWSAGGGGGGSQTPWTSDINASKFNLTNANSVRLSNGTTIETNSFRGMAIVVPGGVGGYAGIAFSTNVTDGLTASAPSIAWNPGHSGGQGGELEVTSDGSISLNPGQGANGGKIHLNSSGGRGQWTAIQHDIEGYSAFLFWSTDIGGSGNGNVAARAYTNANGTMSLVWYNPAPIYDNSSFPGHWDYTSTHTNISFNSNNIALGPDINLNFGGNTGTNLASLNRADAAANRGDVTNIVSGTSSPYYGPFTNLISWSTTSALPSISNATLAKVSGDVQIFGVDGSTHSAFPTRTTMHSQYWVSNSYDDVFPDIINIYNGFNASGSGAQVDTTVASMSQGFESSWQNGNQFAQSEYYLSYTYPFTNFTFRPFAFNFVRNTNRTAVTPYNVNGNIVADTFSFYNIFSANNAAQILMTCTRNSDNAALAVNGIISTTTNKSNDGGLSIRGGNIDVRNKASSKGFTMAMNSGQFSESVGSISANGDPLIFYYNSYLRAYGWLATQVPFETMANSASHNTNLFENKISSGAIVSGVTSNGTIFSTAGFSIVSNGVALWPSAARLAGDAFLGNSNGTIYLLTSTPGSTAWAATNKLGP